MSAEISLSELTPPRGVQATLNLAYVSAEFAALRVAFRTGLLEYARFVSTESNTPDTNGLVLTEPPIPYDHIDSLTPIAGGTLRDYLLASASLNKAKGNRPHQGYLDTTIVKPQLLQDAANMALVESMQFDISAEHGPGNTSSTLSST